MLGLSNGSSPIRADSWAPTGLKYLRRAILHIDVFWLINISFKILSIVYFVLPYGFRGSQISFSQSNF